MGGDITDQRGDEWLKWAMANHFTIANNPRSLATFENSRGRSWVDLTLYRQGDVGDWEVKEEETLSDHRYICFKIHLGTTRGKEQVIKGFEFAKTDWGL